MGLLAATWGASYLFIKIGLRDLSAPAVVFLRTSLAALVLLPVALRRNGLAGLGARWADVALIAVVQVAGPFLLISVGEHHIPSALAGILVASAPIWTALLAPFVDDTQRSSGLRLVGVVVGMVGVVLLFGVDLAGDADMLLGGALVLVAGLGYALGALLLKLRLPRADPAGVAVTTMAASAAMTLPLALVWAPSSVSADSIGAMLALGCLGTGLAFLVYYTLIAEVGPARSSLVAYIAPGFAVLYGALLLDEAIGVGTVAGLALILAGSWLGAGGRGLPGRRATTA